jgi:hypothetical protein
VFRPAVLLRVESLLVLVGSTALYRHFGGSWLLFIVLFFAPDISIAVYLVSARLGWRAYNLAHTYASPLLVIGLSVLTDHLRVAVFGLIWCAHIGWDRLLAFGMKLGEAFWETHLGPLHRERELWRRVVALFHSPSGAS